MSEARKLEIRTKKVGTYEIVYEGGGVTPDTLKGDWNRMAMAQQAVAAYEDTQSKLSEVKKEKIDLEAVVARREEERKAKNAERVKKQRAKAEEEKVDGEGSVGV